MPKVQRHHYGSHWCIHGYANFGNIIFRTENKCSKLTFENGEKIKLFKWLWELLCFEMGKILRKGRLSLQFKNVLRVCSFLFYMMAYGSLIYRHQKNASWKTIYRHSEIIKKVEMLKLSHPNDYIDDFCIETESTILSGNLLERMKPNGTYLNYQVCRSSSGSKSFLYY